MEQGKLTAGQFEEIKNRQIKELKELELEAIALVGWVKEFRELLERDSTPEEIFAWSVENDIESEFKHITLS